MFDNADMVHPLVIARLPNVLGDLLAWGRDPDGWWGLVVWARRAQAEQLLQADVRCSAWMPAGTLSRSSNDALADAYRDVVRLDLPADRGAWPTPADRRDLPTEHHGVITTLITPDGQPLSPPDTPRSTGSQTPRRHR